MHETKQNQKKYHEKKHNITAVILAGGKAKRMGGDDKAFIKLNHKNFIENAIEKLQKQTKTLIINANGDPKRFRKYPYPVCPDTIKGFQGPLAGILTAMEWAQHNKPNHAFIVSIAVDTPFFPDNLIFKFVQKQKAENADIVLAKSQGNIHPVFGLWKIALAQNLRNALEKENLRKIRLWTDHHHCVTQNFSSSPHDPFFNANTPQEKEKAQKITNEI